MSITLNERNTRLVLRTNDKTYGSYDGRYLAFKVDWVNGTAFNINTVVYSTGNNNYYFNVNRAKATIDGETRYWCNSSIWTARVFPAKAGTDQEIINTGKVGRVNATLEGLVWYGNSGNRLATTLVSGSMWIPYYVTYNLKGGSGSFGAQRKYYGEALTIHSGSPTKTGHTFKGWNRGNSTSTSVTHSPGGAITQNSNSVLYAVWTVNNYTVTFNAMGGTTPSPTSKKVDYNANYGTLATTSREGYSFLGWYTSSTGGTKITSTTKMTQTSAHTLYAHWDLDGVVRLYNNNAWRLAVPYVYNNNAWRRAMPYTYNNGWKVGV